jgi:hypothetical protein
MQTQGLKYYNKVKNEIAKHSKVIIQIQYFTNMFTDKLAQ